MLTCPALRRYPVFLWEFLGVLATGSEAEGAWGDAGWE